MRIIISGGCGFIGSNLALNLKTNHPAYEIIVLDNLKRRGSELNIPRLKEKDITFIHGDMRCWEDLQGIDGGDLFIDASAEPSVLAGINSSQRQLVNNNLVSTINALDWCAQHKAKFLFLSTSRVYPIMPLEQANYAESALRFDWTDEQSIPGLSAQGVSEAFDMTGYRSLYGATKYASEILIHEYAQYLGVSAVINRCGVISGPWQMGKIDQGVVVLWLARHMTKKPLSYIGYGGQGKQVRDMLHIDDLCNLLDMQIQNWSKGEGQVFNVGGGLQNSASLRELTAVCEKVTGNRIDISSDTQNREADLRIYITNAQKVSHTFGWQPTRNVETLLSETFNWMTENEKLIEKILL